MTTYRINSTDGVLRGLDMPLAILVVAAMRLWGVSPATFG